MALLTPERRETLRYASRHPITFFRGRNLPPEEVRPWEQAAHLSQGLVGLRQGFLWRENWILQNYFHMDPNRHAQAGFISAMIDGATDPIIGAFMDTKNYPIRIQRWLQRLGIVVDPLLRMLPMLFVGLTDLERLILIIICRFARDLLCTPGDIGGEKVFTHITGDNAQRNRIAWAWGLGQAVHEMLTPIGEGLLGLRDQFNWNPRVFILTGLGIAYLPALLIQMGPTFVIQRLPDIERPKVEFSLMGFLREMKECFWITRHNKYFWLDNFRALFVAINPGVNEEDFFRFSGVEDVVNLNIAGTRVRGETVRFIRDNVVSIPINVLAPFAIKIIQGVGSPRNAMLLHESVGMVCGTARAAVGIHTMPRVLFHWSMEMFIRTFGRVNQTAERIIQLEMFDYVEWKTGRRSEGATAAINGIKRKMITDGIDAASWRLFAYHVLGFRPALGVAGEAIRDGQGNVIGTAPGQGERYMRYMPILYLWLPMLNVSVAWLSRFFYRYPNELRDQVEADLAERRRLVEEEKTRLEETRESVGVGFD